MRRFVLAALVSGLGFSAAQADPVLLTFEGQYNLIYNAPITRSGFDIGNPAAQEQHFHEITSTDFGLPSNGTGVLLNDRNTEIYFVPNAGGGFTTFSLTSIDVASSLNNFPADDLLITGYLNNIPTGSILVSPLGNGYTSVNGAALGIMDRIVFDGQGGQGGFVLDNALLDTDPAANTPEPMSMAVFGGLAVAGIVGYRRRAKA